MAKATVLRHSFSAGEASYAALARVDQETIQLTAERQENIFPYVVGKGIMRPGTAYLGSSIVTPPTAAPVLVPFKRSPTETALLEFSLYTGFPVNNTIAAQAAMRVFVNDQVVTYPSVNANVPFPTALWVWNSVLTGDATANQGDTTGVVLVAPSLGSEAILKQTGTTSSPNILHCLKVIIGDPNSAGFSGTNDVNFRVGSVDGQDDYIPFTDLPPGVHFLAFTPTGANFFIQFETTSPSPAHVLECSLVPPGNLIVPIHWWPATSLTINLSQIQWTQSLDVIFISVAGAVNPIMVQRRGDHSWSVCQFYADDGPFQASQSDPNVYLTPSATTGKVTITASKNFWNTYAANSNPRGQLIKITHDAMDSKFGIAAQNVATPAFRVTGIQTPGDRAWSAIITGTWVGTINVERSFNDQFSGFEKYTAVADINGNGTTSVNDANDNTIIWYRFKFTTYVSGTAYVEIKYGGYGFTGVARIISAQGTSATAEVIMPFANTTPSNIWLEGEWSPNRGFPTAVTLFDGRLWWSKSDKLEGSVSDAYFSYATELPNLPDGTAQSGDSSSIQRLIATGGSFDDIAYLLPLQRLILGTSGAEVSARSSSLDEPLTPTNITLRDASSQGAAYAMAVKVDKHGIFIQRSTHKLYALIYNPYEQDYGAENLMRINEDIGYPQNPAFTIGFIQLAVQRQPETYVWAIRSDGVACLMIYEPNEKVRGWFRMTTGQDLGDTIQSVAVLPTQGEDAVYFIANRNGTYTVEKMQSHYNTLTRSWDAINLVQKTAPGLFQCDCYSVVTPSGVGGYTLSGFPQLNGRTVIALGFSFSRQSYGPLLNQNGGKTFVVSNGTITLGESPVGNVTVGLPYTGFYKSSKLAYGAGGGNTPLLKKKKVNAVGLLLIDTHPDALQVGSDFFGIETMDPMPRIEDLLPVVETGFLNRVYDKQPFPIANVWDTDARVCIEVNPGYSATLSGLVMEVEAGDG